MSIIKLVKYILLGFIYKIVGLNDFLIDDYVIYCGENVVEMFV